MCGLAHYFEDEGVASTAIALMREHAEAIRAPRALWVPFELGRPLGAPDEPAFQRRVLRAALDLLVSENGPVVLTDFPDEAPGPKADDSTGWVCPVNFAAPPDQDNGPAATLLHEIDALSPWYQMSRDRRGRTLVGVSGLEVREAARFVASVLDAAPLENPIPDKPLGQAFKDALTDIMAYYSEAGAAQPGRRSSGEALSWFWTKTAAGGVFQDVRARLLESDDETLRFVGAKVLLPKIQGG